MLLFDFVGCGKSKGEFVTLGINEAQDLVEIVLTMKRAFGYEEIYLWGRSMGAVSIIRMLHHVQYKVAELKEKRGLLSACKKAFSKSSREISDIADKLNKLEADIIYIKKLAIVDKVVKAVVLDSPFTSASKMLRTAIKFHADTNDVTTSIVLLYLKFSIKQHIGEDIIAENRPKDLVSEIKVPAVFFLGEKDELITQKTFRKMFERYGSDLKKFRLLVETDHSDERSDEDVDFGVKFIKRHHLNLKEKALTDLDEHVISTQGYGFSENKFDVISRVMGSISSKINVIK